MFGFYYFFNGNMFGILELFFLFWLLDFFYLDC